jgi:hypothetical protein
MKNDRLIFMTEYQLESLVHSKSRKANQELYNGISNVLNDIQRQLRTIQDELDYIKLSTQPKPRKKKAVEDK